MQWSYLGLHPYGKALDLQHRLVDQHRQGRGEDTLLLLQHPPVITLGRRAREDNVLALPEQLSQYGIEVYRVERGGDVTYHGPGQLVGYPVLNLANFKTDVRWYVTSIADVLVRTLTDLGVRSEYRPDLPGVWVGDAKIAAIGARIENWITYHGFALNVGAELQAWQFIVPCGLADKGVTSLSSILQKVITVEQVIPLVISHFAVVFKTNLREVPPAQIAGIV